MEKLTVKAKIFATLKDNAEKVDSDFMSVEEIAKETYGDAYMKETSKHLNGLVQRNMTHAIAMLAEDGEIVITLKAPTKNGNKIKKKTILGYKIAAKEDSEYVVDNLSSRSERLEIAKQMKLGFQNLAIDNDFIITDNRIE